MNPAKRGGLIIIKIDELSLSTLRLQMQFQNTPNEKPRDLALGTGFLWLHNNKIYLITNKHNVTGRHFETGKPLSGTCGVPNIMQVTYNIMHNGGGISRGSVVSIYLYNGQNDPNSNNPVPMWIDDKKNNSDIVAIDLDPHLKTNHNVENFVYANTVRSDIHMGVAQDAFVLGYPKGIDVQHFPIWKRASIASEPSIGAYKNQPTFFIDTATKEGMSGAPVYAYYSGAYPTEGGVAINSGTASKFLGVYSGRLGDNEVEAQLGIVWKQEAIERLFV